MRNPSNFMEDKKMKIGIIGAMQMEVDNLKEALENQTTETKAE